ncbi:MAG: hypothetical protein LBV04_02820 [Deferribacteraceae bacterium]|jgi:hypothetical protein|nr:hypothetical protein [Deferribacteraceae bacterium]
MLINAVLTLFKALPIEDLPQHNDIDDEDTLRYGFLFAPECKAYGKMIKWQIKRITDMYGFDIGKYNQAAFYKSFDKVKNAAATRLRLDKLLHYMSTYTAESLGVYDESAIYVPTSALSLPEGKPLKITIIKGLRNDEIKERVLSLITKGVALSTESVKAVMAIIKLLPINDIDIDTVKNREVKAALYEHYGIMPQDPQEFLRLLIYASTGDTLIIKNDALIAKITASNPAVALNLLTKYEEQHTLAPLASIFLRYKPLFLAYKKAHQAFREIKHYKPELIAKINRLRKLAKQHHKPLRPAFLDTVTAAAQVELHGLQAALTKASIYRKVRLYNAISYRLSNPASIAYKIRNQKIYATKYHGGSKPQLEPARELIFNEIVRQVAAKTAGTKFYIPDEVIYAFPTSEKMFFGSIPYGSSVYLGDKAILGVHWEDNERQRIDLDLHGVNASACFGWDSSYRDGDIFYSGDMTAAPLPNGATEAYWFGEGFTGGMLMTLNFYNYGWQGNRTQPFKLIVDTSSVDIKDRSHILSQCSIATSVQAEITTPQEIIGLMTSDSSGKQYYFLHFLLGRGISTNISEKSTNAFQFLYQSTKTQLTLNRVLQAAGALTDKANCDIDLSLESIDKTTLLEFL